ncbi:alpha/beta fold hydrolase [Tranquillimonas alkanivorans]|uniref:Pimeloyl-ACP methyl ester carboxylesterase n=1 Tax=Tranquillimonas alkanivorans TaxID=441119 RepID=A0A1I5SYM3_9RHOB|nr:alpha/beta fold hydrolase [Tranquillimonas alkanivorans]SFP75875.1 Pimeloyl-ACP methyl ester carboxylesterase [Tranquillimonas alkanivorans]
MPPLPLATIEHPSDGDAVPVLIAHGLFGSARNWGVIAKRLSDRGPVTAVDMRNHGDSPWADSHGYHEMAEDLAGMIDGQCDVIGHSMGGKAAMALALLHPEKVRRLVVADIAPVAYGHTQMHLVDAMRVLDLSDVRLRSDADAKLAEVVETPGVRAFLLQSLDLKGKCWKLNLDVLAAEMERIVGWPVDIGDTFDGPAFFLSGENSDYVLPEHRDVIRDLFPKARFAKLSGAGHWLHAEKPREFEASVRAFLDA